MKHSDGGPLLEVRSVVTSYPAPGRRFGRISSRFNAVDGVSFEIARGKSLGLVGESGCGKTTLGRTILRLVPADAGQVIFDGVDVFALDRPALRRFRRRMQMVFQDPGASLNPRMLAGAIVGEPLVIHGLARGKQLEERVAVLFERVGLSPLQMNKLPHEFSGGQRQRLGIARAMALEPEFIVCDEPVSSLDVSVQSQVLNLLADLRAAAGLSCLFIAHNLAVVQRFSDHVAVMYLGRIVETGPVDDVFSRPGHPYTLALLDAVPQPVPTGRAPGSGLPGEVPSPVDPPSGCAFHPRCRFATEVCSRQVPALEPRKGLDSGHKVACHHADECLT